MSDLEQLTDLQKFMEINKQAILAEQERSRIEAERLEEERIRRVAEQNRVEALKNLTVKIDTLLNIVVQMKPTVEMLVRNGDIIIEILRILPGSISHLSENEITKLTEKLSILSKVPITQPVNVHVGTQFEATQDLNINTTGDQQIG